MSRPHDICALGAAGIQQLFCTHHERCGPTTAAHIVQIFEQSQLMPRGQAVLFAQHVQHLCTGDELHEQQVAACEAQAISIRAEFRTHGDDPAICGDNVAIIASVYIVGIAVATGSTPDGDLVVPALRGMIERQQELPGG